MSFFYCTVLYNKGADQTTHAHNLISIFLYLLSGKNKRHMMGVNVELCDILLIRE